MKEITFLTDDELKSIIDGCVDGVYPTTQEIAMANELIIARAKIAELKHRVSVLGATCEVYSWEIHNLERINHINEIQAQGIEWAVEQAANDCTYRDDPVIVLERVEKYAEQLRKQINEQKPVNYINEIKARGVEEAIKNTDAEKCIFLAGDSVGADALLQQYRTELERYIKTLRTKHD